MSEYLHVATAAELEKQERAMFEAHRLEQCRAKGLPDDSPSFDVDQNGKTVLPPITVRLVAPIVDPDGVQPGGLILVDQHVQALQGKVAQVDDGGVMKPVAIDVSAKVQRAALPQQWQAVLTKLETAADAAKATPVGETPPAPMSTAMRVVTVGGAAATTGAAVGAGLMQLAAVSPTIAVIGGVAAALAAGAAAFFGTGSSGSADA